MGEGVIRCLDDACCSSDQCQSWAGDWAAVVPLGVLMRRAAALGGTRPSKPNEGKAVAPHTTSS